MLPFTREQFLTNFLVYNEAVWPAQLLAYLLGLSMLALIPWRNPVADRLIAGGLALMWLWTGIFYHAVFFAEINRAALGFGLFFVIESLLLAYAGVIRVSLRFAPPDRPSGWLGAGLIAYAGVLYPLIGLSAGHGFGELPAFGITPCPVTLFSLGMLLLTSARVPPWVLAIPLLWALIGGTAAFLLGVVQDWPLLIAGPLAVSLIVARDRRSRNDSVAAERRAGRS